MPSTHIQPPSDDAPKTDSPFEGEDAEQLWSALMRKEPKAFTEFFRIVHAPILRRARAALARNGVKTLEVSAQDIVQSVMLQVWGKIEESKLKECDGLLGFWKLTCHILAHKSIDRRRRQSAKRRPPIARSVSNAVDESGVRQALLQIQSRERAPDEEVAVMDCFDELYSRLPADCQSVFVLWGQGLNDEEIGAAHGRDRSWVYRKKDIIKREMK